jgi:hypothetical protein
MIDVRSHGVSDAELHRMATIEHRFGLSPLTARDATVQDLSTVFGHGGHGDRD